jgi:hypothetical protein
MAREGSRQKKGAWRANMMITRSFKRTRQGKEYGFVSAVFER